MAHSDGRLRITDGVKPRSSGEVHPAMKTKRCNKCSCLKQKTEFYRDAIKKDGLAGVCKSCANARKKQTKAGKRVQSIAPETVNSVINGLTAMQARSNAGDAVPVSDPIPKLSIGGYTSGGGKDLQEELATMKRQKLIDTEYVENLLKEMNELRDELAEVRAKYDNQHIENNLIAAESAEAAERNQKLVDQNKFLMAGNARLSSDTRVEELEAALITVAGCVVVDRPVEYITDLIKSVLQ